MFESYWDMNMAADEAGRREIARLNIRIGERNIKKLDLMIVGFKLCKVALLMVVVLVVCVVLAIFR